MPKMKKETKWRRDLGQAHLAAILEGRGAALGVGQATYNVPRAGAGAAFMETPFPGSQMISDAVLPLFPTRVQKGKYPAITRETVTMAADAKRGPSGDYNRVDFEAEDKSFACEEFGLEGRLGDDQRALYAQDFDAEEATVGHIRGLLALAREVRVATAIFNGTTWTGATLYSDESSSYPWATTTTTVIPRINNAKAKIRTNTGVEPNALVIGRVNLDNLLANSTILARFPGAALVTEAMLRANLAAIFGLKYLLVGGAVKNSKTEGATAYSGADVWTGYAMVAKVAENPLDLAEACVGRTFLWTEDSAADPIVESYREEQRRSEIYRVRHNLDEVVIDANFGFLIKTV